MISYTVLLHKFVAVLEEQGMLPNSDHQNKWEDRTAEGVAKEAIEI